MKKYAQFIIKPEIEINIVKYRPISFYIIGEVEDPGFYTIPGSFEANISGKPNSNTIGSEDQLKLHHLGLRLATVTFLRFDSLRIAGGISEYSDLSNLEVVREIQFQMEAG